MYKKHINFSIKVRECVRVCASKHKQYVTEVDALVAVLAQAERWLIGLNGKEPYAAKSDIVADRDSGTIGLIEQ